MYLEEIAAAKKSDVVIAVLGTGLYNEKEGQDKTHLNLPGDQEEMLKAVSQVNQNIVVVLINGSQHTISWVKKNIPAILNAWYPGEQGGNAIAEVLFGRYNPAGRLPLTYYETVNNLPEMERYEISEGRTYMYYQGKPLWTFGHGLSYSQFEYSGLELNDSIIDETDEIEISLKVKKHRKKWMAMRVVQLYLSYPDSKHNRPLKQLRGFERVTITKGETKKINFMLNKEDLKYWSTAKQDWDVEKGSVKVMIGASSTDIRLNGSFMVGG